MLLIQIQIVQIQDGSGGGIIVFISNQERLEDMQRRANVNGGISPGLGWGSCKGGRGSIILSEI